MQARNRSDTKPQCQGICSFLVAEPTSVFSWVQILLSEV